MVKLLFSYDEMLYMHFIRSYMIKFVNFDVKYSEAVGQKYFVKKLF